MKYLNGKDAKPGDLVVGRDIGKNLVSGHVVLTMPARVGDNKKVTSPDALRLTGVPLLVPSEQALLVEDAFELASASLTPTTPTEPIKTDLSAIAEPETPAGEKGPGGEAPATNAS